MSEIDSPIFIIGTGRSGTSLLRRLLNRHSNIHICFETFLLPLNRIWQNSNLSVDFRKRYQASLPFHWQPLGDKSINGDSIQQVYENLMRQSAAQFRKNRIGDKTPPNAFFLPTLFELFPKARVIHVTRDPLNTIDSLQRMPWAPASRLLTALLIHFHYRKTWKYRDKIIDTKIENLLSYPKQELTRILNFIGEPWEEILLASPPSEGDDEPNLPWLTHPIQTLPNSAAKQESSPGLECLVEKILKRTRLNYHYPKQESADASHWLRSIPCLPKEAMNSIEFAFRIRKATKLLNSQSKPNLQETADAFYSLNPQARTLYDPAQLQVDKFLPTKKRT